MLRAGRIAAQGLGLIWMLAGAPSGASDRAGRVDVPRSALSMVESGKTLDGKPLYTIKAENVDIGKALKTLYARMGEPSVVIEENVRGPISFALRNVTAEEIVQGVQDAAYPPIKITRGKVITVSRSTDIAALAAQIRERMERMTANRMGARLIDPGLIGIRPASPFETLPLDNPVSLSVPQNAPITLGAAAEELQKQTQVPIRLARSVDGNIKFLATITQMPLRLVLNNIAPGGAGSLKWVTMGDYVLIAPADRLQVFQGSSVIGSTEQCAHCHQPLGYSWSYCPICGYPTSHGMLVNPALRNLPRRLP